MADAEVARGIFERLIADREAQAKESAAMLRGQVAEVNRQVEKMLSRLMYEKCETVISTYEKKIEQLERDKALLSERAANPAKPSGSFEEHLEPILTFLPNPWKLWETGEITLRRLVLKLCFADQINCYRNEGRRTPETALPFKALGGEMSSVDGDAPDENNLEPISDVDLLSELEAWSDILAAEPMVSERLAKFAAKAEAQGDGAFSEHQKSVAPDAPPGGPEVSP